MCTKVLGIEIMTSIMNAHHQEKADHDDYYSNKKEIIPFYADFHIYLSVNLIIYFIEKIIQKYKKRTLHSRT